MKKLICLILTCAALFTLCACDKTEQSSGAEDSSVAVETQTASLGEISASSTVSGTVTTDDSTSVFISSTAKCLAVYFHAGDEVKKGDIICSLDLDSMLSTYNAASIGYNSAVSSYAAQEEIFSKQVALCEKNLNDAKALYEIGAASKMEIDSAELSLLTIKSQRDSTLAQLRAGIENAKASLSQLDLAMENIDGAGNIISPVNGTLASLSATEGGYISSSAPVAVIDGAKQMKITVSVSEALMPKLSIGDEVSVHIASAGADFVSVIRSVDRTANQMTKLYAVTVSVPAAVSNVIDGMFADVTFKTDVSENAVIIPSEAILTSGEEQFVYTVVDGLAVRTLVKAGLSGDGVTEVTDGLSEGDVFVTVGQQYLSDGDAVRIVSSEE